jgi:peptidoglycan/LPS O-acetylase OafA/YrhL
MIPSSTMKPGIHLPAAASAPLPQALCVPVPSRRIGERGSAILDMLRAASAALVMIGHVRGLFFVPYADVADKGWVKQALYFITGLGHEAVMVFFALSGFFISANIFHAFGTGRWKWDWYLGRRVTRLSVVLLPTLLIGLAFDKAGLALFGADGPYGGGEGYGHIIVAPVAERLGWTVFLGNAAYLQEIFVPTFGSNGPLWSLSYEFWYYLLFPCLVVAGFGRGLARRAIHGLAAAAIALLVGERILLYFLIWLFGVGAFLTPPNAALARRGLIRSAALAGTGAVLLVLLAAGKLHPLPQPAGDMAVGIVCAVLVYLFAHTPSADVQIEKSLFGKLAHLSAGFSYTLYLAHLPALVFLCAWLARRWQPDFVHGLYGLAITAGVLAYAFALSRVTEARTGWVRRALFGARAG